MKQQFSDFFTAASFRLFGKVASHFPSFKKDYQKSGIARLYESYVALMLFACLALFVFAFATFALIHYIVFKLGLLQNLGASIALSASIALLASITFLTYPLYLKNLRKGEIDANLVYTVGYMGVLSAGGISTERIFDRVLQVEPRPSIMSLAKGFVTNVRMFGLDVVSSLESVMSRSPSEVFSKLILSIANTVETSGDLRSLLIFETKRLLNVKREQLKKTLNALIALAEIYVTAVVLAPITFIVMITILSIMGNVAFGVSPATQLNLIVFVGLPMISLVFILILNSVLPEEG